MNLQDNIKGNLYYSYNMKEYIIFEYKKGYIEAYPTHGAINCQNWLPFGIKYALLSSVSRNQALKSAYINWIDSSGYGFNYWVRNIYDKYTKRKRNRRK